MQNDYFLNVWNIVLVIDRFGYIYFIISCRINCIKKLYVFLLKIQQ